MGHFHVRVLACLFLAVATGSGAGAQDAASTSSPVTSRELVEISGLGGLSVSPDGQRAVIRVDQQSLDDNRTRLTWTVVDLRDGKPTPLADGGTPRRNVNGGLDSEQPQWSADGQWIYFRRVDGEEAQLWRASRDGAQLQQLTHDASDLSAFIVDEQGVHYAVGPATREQIKAAEQVEYEQGVYLDSSFILGYRPTHNFPVNGRMATYRRSPGARNFGYATLLGETPLVVKSLLPNFSETVPASETVVEHVNRLWAESGGGSRPFDPQREGRATSASGISASVRNPDPARPEGGPVLSWTGPKGKPTHCAVPICTDADSISVVGWTIDGSLIFRTQTFGTNALNRVNGRTGKVATLLRTEAALGSSVSGLVGECQIAGEEAICISAAADQPPRLIGVHVQSGRVRTLFDPNPTLTPERLGVPSRITLTDRYGNSTFGRVILPRDRKPGVRLPLVITSYMCGGFLLGGSGKDEPEHVLAGLGFATVCVDSSGGGVRRVPGWAPTLAQSQISGLDFFEGAVRALDQQGVVDPDRVMLTGFSGTANATTFAISHSRMFAAAAITTGGSSDVMVCYLASHYRNCAGFAKKEGYTRPYDSRSGVWADSPAWNADRIATPLLMQLPETEYPEMMQLYSSMRDYERAVEMHIFADAYHDKTQPRQRLAVYNRNVDWANFWLRGLNSSDPTREDQNERWGKLREDQCRLFAGERAIANPPWYCNKAASPEQPKQASSGVR